MRENIQEIKVDRIKYAKDELTKLGIEFTYKGQEIQFYHKDQLVKFYPFTGWHTGKSINDGRGIKNLIKQLLIN